MVELKEAESMLKGVYLNAIAEALKDEKPVRERTVCAGYGRIYKSPPTKQIGRNSLCPCGSGKKYKKCCGGNVCEK